MLPRGNNLRPKHARIVLAAIDDFTSHAIEAGWNTMDGATSQCTFAAEAFMDCLRDHGLPVSASRIEWYDMDTTASWHPTEARVAKDIARYPYEDLAEGYYIAFHVAVRIGNLIVDFTARQFDPKADFPAIWLDHSHMKKRVTAQASAQNRAT